MTSKPTFTQFVIAIVLFVVVLNILPQQWRLLAGGTILLGAAALNPGAVRGLADWLRGL